MSEKTLQTHSRGSIVFKQIISCPKRAAFCHLHNVFIINHLPFSSASKGPFRLLIAWRLASTRRVFRQSEQPFERTRAQRLHAHPFPFAASPACFRLPIGHPAHSNELNAHFQKVVFIVTNIDKHHQSTVPHTIVPGLGAPCRHAGAASGGTATPEKPLRKRPNKSICRTFDVFIHPKRSYFTKKK